MPLSPGQVLNNRYRIVKLLGKGGFGAVYRAWDVNLNRPCAVKENLDASAEAQKQFGREATLLADLIHPNLSRVIDYFFIPNQGQYFVMDFIEGQDLAQMVQGQGSPLPKSQALPWIVQICDVLTYLHSQEPPIIHRDIKPANIKITPQGKAVLVDFGIAKIFDPNLRTTVGARAVTPGYTPFEQYGQAPTDERTDIYALGATTYAVLTGREPTESIARMAGAALTAPSQINPALDPHLEQAILRAMQVMPTERYQSAAQFKTALLAAYAPASPEQPAVASQVQPQSAPVAVAPQAQPLPTARSAPAQPATGATPARSAPAGWRIALFGVAGLLVVIAAVVGLLMALRPDSRATQFPSQVPAVLSTSLPTGPPTARSASATPVAAAASETTPTSGATLPPEEQAWTASAHAEPSAEAFVRWNQDDPPEVPTTCAGCHSTSGHLDLLGADGSTVGEVDQPVPAGGETIQCEACHSPAAETLTSVVFPSGIEITGLQPLSANCMTCHQGRASTYSVDARLEELGLVDDPDRVSEELGFINIHYYAAAYTLFGGATKGGYEYADRMYGARNAHVIGYDSCVDCHDGHSLQLKIEACAACHPGVNGPEQARSIRMAGSLADYDGDGDIEEGLASEITGLQELLYQAIQTYARQETGNAIVYAGSAYPYFFIDSDGDGQANDDEAQADNRYNTWSGRLLKAAYNYQVASKDPGAYAHGSKYTIQLLHDSIEDLNQVISPPVDLSQALRSGPGHFDGSHEAFRHWDEQGEVPDTCSRCHSATGLPRYLDEGASAPEPIANGLACTTCHDDLASFTRYRADQVVFPSGAQLSFGQADDNNLCISCHQGRSSKANIDEVIAESGAGDDQYSETLRFFNPHYFAAGATLFGAEAAGAYQYDGKQYRGRNEHASGFDTCSGCHDVHSLNVRIESCVTCHPYVRSESDLAVIHISQTDFDGDSDSEEGIAMEIEHEAEMLYDAIQAYAARQGLPAIVYEGGFYPYWFTDAGESYTSWTPRLLRATFNYQWVQKDPGAYAHNGTYILQILYDTLQDLDANIGGLTRPD